MASLARRGECMHFGAYLVAQLEERDQVLGDGENIPEQVQLEQVEPLVDPALQQSFELDEPLAELRLVEPARAVHALLSRDRIGRGKVLLQEGLDIMLNDRHQRVVGALHPELGERLGRPGEVLRKDLERQEPDLRRAERR